MIDFTRITGFDWDIFNVEKNKEKHDVLPSEAEQIFVNLPLIIAADEVHSQMESRWFAYGITFAGRLLFVSFTLRKDNTLIRVISARDMTHKERKNYERYS